MPKAATMTTTGNVVTLLAAPDTYITRFMAAAAAQEAAVLPRGWFKCALEPNEDDGVRLDYLEISRIAGPPVGHYVIHREQRHFALLWISDDRQGDLEGIERCRTLSAAFRAIRKDIDQQLAAWQVTVAPAC